MTPDSVSEKPTTSSSERSTDEQVANAQRYFPLRLEQCQVHRRSWKETSFNCAEKQTASDQASI